MTFCCNTILNCNNYVFFHLKFEIFSSYKLPKESPPLIDLDWLASDLPITTHTNGAIFVMTMDLNNSTSSMAQMDLDGMYLCLTLPLQHILCVNCDLFNDWLCCVVIKVLYGVLTSWSQNQVSF